MNAWTTPHVLTIADDADVTTLNPHLSTFASTANLSEMTMAWLVKWDEHNQPYPELATAVPTQTNGGVSKDGLTVTYHLRKGVKWSDGAPFDADDVVFSTAAAALMFAPVEKGGTSTATRGTSSRSRGPRTRSGTTRRSTAATRFRRPGKTICAGATRRLSARWMR